MIVHCTETFATEDNEGGATTAPRAGSIQRTRAGSASAAKRRIDRINRRHPAQSQKFIPWPAAAQQTRRNDGVGKGSVGGRHSQVHLERVGSTRCTCSSFSCSNYWGCSPAISRFLSPRWFVRALNRAAPSLPRPAGAGTRRWTWCQPEWSASETTGASRPRGPSHRNGPVAVTTVLAWLRPPASAS